MVAYTKIIVLLISAVIFVGKIQLSSSQSIESIITRDFYNRVKSGTSGSCKGSTFYTYDGFIAAAKAGSFAGFGTTGSIDVRKKELAAFFANVAHETGNLCYVEQIERDTYCQPSTETEYPCAGGKQYYGRGPLQLSWNYNYGAAGKYFGLPLLNNPDLVAQQPDVAYKTSLWFWMVNSDCHSAITSGNGFGSTIRAINGNECNGHEADNVESRVSFYKKFCGWLGVSPGTNLYC